MLVSCGALFCAAAGPASASTNRLRNGMAIAAPRARDLVLGVIQGIPNEGGRRQACDQHIAETTSKSTKHHYGADAYRRRRRAEAGSILAERPRPGRRRS